MPILNWIGKDKVVNHDKDVPYHVLDESYTFGGETSENLIIHGDNLAALKSLLPRYVGRVKCIYIDPPYNTGNEKWVYNDNVNDPRIKKWLGQVVGKESEDLSRHDKWLCMMYPRLKLLKELLADDGAIFISIDDNEQANLRLICDEIFGRQNFIAQMIVASNSSKNNSKFISVSHEYIFCYAKNSSFLSTEWKVKKNNVDEFVKRAKRLLKMNLSQDEIHAELLELVKYPRFYDFDHYTYADEKGVFRSSNSSGVKNGNHDIKIIHPLTGKICANPVDGWRFKQEIIDEMLKNNQIFFGKDESIIPTPKHYLEENICQTPKSTLFFDSQSSTKWLKMQRLDFPFPKAVELIEYVLSFATDKNSIILDSFAGSGTTAHAVLNLNRKDGGNRKFILIEMGEYAQNITTERIKRVITANREREREREAGGSPHENENFTFYELGEPLLLENGFLNENIPNEKIYEYIYFTQTQENYTKQNESYFLGEKNGVAYYFIYEKDQATALNLEFLAKLKKADSYVIYADLCILDDEFMQKHNIEFKKIPRDIKRF